MLVISKVVQKKACCSPFCKEAQKRMRVYFIGLVTCQFPIKTGQADGESLERAKREAEVHSERIWGHTAELEHEVVR